MSILDYQVLQPAMVCVHFLGSLFKYTLFTLTLKNCFEKLTIEIIIKNNGIFGPTSLSRNPLI